MGLEIQEKLYPVRDGTLIAAKIVSYCDYPNIKSLIFYHGGSFNHKRYMKLAKILAKHGITTILLDMRGHGDSSGNKGTTDYIGQLEDDLEDILVFLTVDNPSANFFVGGHSSGAVVVLRHNQKYGSRSIQGYIFISPALTAPELIRYPMFIHKLFYFFIYHRRLSNQTKPLPTSEKNIPKMNIWKYILCKLLPFLRNKLTIVTFPGEYKMAMLENRTLNYTYNMVSSCCLGVNYASIFLKLNAPALVMVGENDEIIDPTSLKNILTWNTSPLHEIKFMSINGCNHLNICHQVDDKISTWINNHA